MDKPTLAAIELAIETQRGEYYDGDLCPEPVGHWVWDAAEECYAVRVAEKDQPWSRCTAANPAHISATENPRKGDGERV